MTKEANSRNFLSYAHDNLEMVRKVYDGLIERQVNVWFDKVDLGPGKWKRQIEKTIPKCRYFVVCISEAALRKAGDENPGFLDDEIQQAYEIARVQPESSFTIIPVRLEDCDRGDHRLAPEQQYDLFNDFEAELDHLAVNLGGMSLADKLAEDTRTEDVKIVEGLYGKGETFYYAGDFQACLNVVNSIITLKPDDTDAWNIKGAALSGLGQKEEAIKAYDKALEIKPDFAGAWYNKGGALSGLGQKEEAIEAYDKALEIKPDFADAWISKGGVLKDLGRYEEAIKAYDKALEIKPDFADAWGKKGIALSMLGRNEEALEAYDKVIEINPDDALAWNTKGSIFIDLGRIKEAYEAFEKSISIYEAEKSVDYGLLRDWLARMKARL